MIERIRQTLKRAGLDPSQISDTDNLFAAGLDSLRLALWILELEMEFHVDAQQEGHYDHLETIIRTQEFLVEQGAS